MAKTLAVDIVGGWLFAAWIDADGTKGRDASALAVELPCALKPENVDELGEWLRRQFAERGIKPGPAVCTLGRGYVTLKSIRTPLCPENELPAIVAFEVEGEWNDGTQSEPVIDFQPGRESSGEREVLVAMAPAALVETVVGMFKKAGMSCPRLGLRPYATCRAWRHGHPDRDEGLLLVMASGPGLLELSVWDGDQLRLCRSVPMEDLDELRSRAAAEVRRTIVTLQSECQDADVKSLVLCDRAQSLADCLRDAVGRPVELFDGEVGHEATNGRPEGPLTAALIGSAAGADWPVDFVNPKRTVAARDNRKLLMALAAALVILIPSALYSYAYYALSRADARLDVYRKNLADLELELQKYEPVLDKHAAIEKWADEGFDWLSELADLSASLPATDRAYLTSLEFNAGQANSRGLIKLQGRAESQALVTETQSAWTSEHADRYRVNPKPSRWLEGASDFGFYFVLDVAVTEPASPDKARVERWAAATERSQKPPDGMRRQRADFASAESSRSRSASKSVAKSKDSTAESKDGTATANEASASTSTGPSASARPSSSASGDSGAKGPVERLVDELKGLSYEEREKKIKEAPSFLQNRIREALKEADK